MMKNLKRWHLFLLGNMILGLTLPISLLFYDRLYRSGTLPANEDSISIPIAYNMIFAAGFWPVLNMLIWFGTRKFNGMGPMFKWTFNTRKEWIVNILTILFIGINLLSFYDDVREPILAFEWFLYDGLWIYFWLCLRAVSLHEAAGSEVRV